MKLSHFYVLLSFLLVWSVCERNLSGPSVDAEGLQITAGESAFSLYNGTDQELRLFLVEQQVAAVIKWSPYCLPSGLILQPDERRSVDYQDVYGYKKDCTVIIYWWTCIEVDGERTPGDIQSTTLPAGPK